MCNNNLIKATDKLSEQLEKLNLNFKKVVYNIHIFESNVSEKLKALNHNLSSLRNSDNYEENLCNIINKFIEVEKFINNISDVLDVSIEEFSYFESADNVIG